MDEDARAIVDALPAIIWKTDANKLVTFLSARWQEYTGRTQDVNSPSSWSEAVHPSCRQVIKEAWQSASAANGRYQAKYRLRRRDGAYRWFQAEGVFVDAPAEKFWIGTLVDVHNAMEDGRQRTIEVSTVTSKLALMHGLVERLPHPLVFVHYPSGRLIHMNELFLSVWRMKEVENSVPDNIASLHLQAFHADGRAFADEDWPIWRACHGQVVEAQHVTVIRGDQSRCIFAMSAYPVIDEEGSPIAAFFMCEDATEKVRTIEKAVSERVATERHEMRNMLLSNVSHEFKTPLTATIGSLTLLEHTSLTEEQRDLVISAQAASANALRRVNDLLDISRLQNGEVLVSESTFALRTCLKELCEKTWNGTELIVDDAVPDIVIGDFSKLGRILGIVIENGSKFKLPGSTDGVTVHCRLARARNADSDKIDLVFEVSDNGIGMTKEVLQKAFAPFAQADDARDRPYGGNGLGLTIANRLAKMMGGTIHIASVPQKGTTVYVELSFNLGAGLSELVGTTKQRTTGENNVQSFSLRSSKSILLAEDNLLSSRIIQRSLALYGYVNVTAVKDGIEAVDAHGSAAYDFILMDCQMPRMDGYEATRIIRKTDGKVPIYALTADSSVAEGMWVDAGMDGYVEKPFKPESLVQILDECLGL